MMRNCSCQGNHHNFSFKLKKFSSTFLSDIPSVWILIFYWWLSLVLWPRPHTVRVPRRTEASARVSNSPMFYVIFRLHSSYNKVKLFKLDCVVFRGQEVVLVSNPVEVLAQLGVDDVLVSAAHSARLVGHQAHGRPTSEILVLSQQCSTRVSLQQSASN